MRFSVRQERIKVRGQPDEVLTVRYTRHGPVISDLHKSTGGPILAVRDGQPGSPTTPPPRDCWR